MAERNSKQKTVNSPSSRHDVLMPHITLNTTDTHSMPGTKGI